MPGERSASLCYTLLLSVEAVVRWSAEDNTRLRLQPDEPIVRVPALKFLFFPFFTVDELSFVSCRRIGCSEASERELAVPQRLRG